MTDDERPVKAMSEPDLERPGVWQGTGAAPPMAANMMMRLMAAGASSREAADAMRRAQSDAGTAESAGGDADD